MFSNEDIAFDEKLRGINLYYNLIKDRFKFEEEIRKLDETWINLKETYNPAGDNKVLKESFLNGFKPILEKFYPTSEKVNWEKYDIIRGRINRIFGLVNKMLNVSIYRGDNTHFASDIVHFRNIQTSAGR